MGLRQTKPQKEEEKNFSNILNECVSVKSTIASQSNNSSAEASSKTDEDDSSESQEHLIKLLKDVLKDFKDHKKEEAHDCTCDNCGRKNFTEYRYKCLICNDYDLCGTCFESRKENKDHVTSHPMSRFDVPKQLCGITIENISDINLAALAERYKTDKHKGVTCNSCSKEQIEGLRFKCDSCNDYDICFECYESRKISGNHLLNHPIIVQLKDSSLEIMPANIELLDELGSGAFGTVYKSKIKGLNKIAACKVIVIEKKQSLFMRLMGMDPSTLYKSYIQELDAYRELKGVNILKMIGHSYEQTDSEIKLMILTEFMENGSLASLLKTQNFKSISLRRRFDIACDISSGMARIHEHGFIHRDIRPDNILISGNYRAKIGDMGIAKFFDLNNNIHTQIGCRAYMPAEFYTGIYDQKLDVYTFGLTLIELFDGLHSKKHPISIEKEAIFMNEYIEKCIQDDPVNRPTSKLLRNSLTLIQKITDKIVFTKLNGYIILPTEIKNKAFKSVYNLVIGEIKKREINEWIVI